MKVVVIQSAAKDLQFRTKARQCSFFAALRMTEFRVRAAKDLRSFPWLSDL